MFQLRFLFFAALASVLTLSACSKINQEESGLQMLENTVGLRPMNQQEAMEDYEEMVALFRQLYGPLEYKETLLGFQFDQWVAEQRQKVAQAKNDTELFAAYAEFISKFKDGHVSIRFAMNETGFTKYTVPLTIAPIEGKVVLVEIGDGLPKDGRFQVGDEIVAVDGKPVLSYLPSILKYNTMATPESNEHWIFRIFSRDFYMLDILPQSPTVQVTFKNKDGAVWNENFVWRLTKAENEKVNFATLSKDDKYSRAFYVHAATDASVLNWGESAPFFDTKEVNKEYRWLKVQANEEFRKKYDLKEDQKPDIFAVMYNYQGKNILLVRNYTYYHQDLSNSVYMNGYRAILDQWQPYADVLVLDQTHNTGGSYCEDFARLFMKNDGGGFVQALNVDRKWMWDLQFEWINEIAQANKSQTATNEEVLAYRLMGKTVEEAYDRGERMTSPQPIMGGYKRIQPDSKFVWKKPMLVLVDEMAGSCGDAFPMLIKANGVAKLFGKRTMGLGGNVEPFVLKNSRATVRLTRGLFTTHKQNEVYGAQDWIENNGVTPDIPYEHTLKDFRDGFVEYVKTFSEKALEQIPAK